MKTKLAIVAVFTIIASAVQAQFTYNYPVPPYPLYWDPTTTNSTTAGGGNGSWDLVMPLWYSAGNTSLGIPEERAVPTPDADGNLIYAGPNAANPTSDSSKFPYELIFNGDGHVKLKFDKFLTAAASSSNYTYSYLRFNGNYTLQSASTTANGTTIGTGNGTFIITVADGKTLDIGGNAAPLTLESASNLSGSITNGTMLGETVGLQGNGTYNFHPNTRLRSASTNARITIGNSTLGNYSAPTVNLDEGVYYNNVPAGKNGEYQGPNRLSLEYGTLNVNGATIYASASVTYAAAREQAIIIGNYTNQAAPSRPVMNINSGSVTAIGGVGSPSGTTWSVSPAYAEGVSLGSYSATSMGGTLNLNGGTLTTTQINSRSTSDGTGQTGIFNFNGGLLRITTAVAPGFTENAVMFTGITPNAYQTRLNNFMASGRYRNDDKSHVAILDGGAFIDTSLIDTSISPLSGQPRTDGTATISTPLRGTGNLTKLGTNTLKLSGSNNYTGNTTVAGGNLLFHGTQATPLIIVQPGAMLSSNSATLKNVTLLGNSTLLANTKVTIQTLTTNPDATITLNITSATSTSLAVTALNTTATPVYFNITGATQAKIDSGQTLATFTNNTGLSPSDIVVNGLEGFTNPQWRFDGQTLALISSSAAGTSPSIIADPPPNPSVQQTENITLSAIINGTGPLDYQWFKDGTRILGNPSARTPSITLTNVQLSAAGNYTLLISNAAGSITTAPANLTVQDYQPPVFTKELPETVSIKTNSTLTLTPSVTGATSYQWLKDGTPISGATDITLSVPDAQETDAGNYTLQATNIYATINSTNCDVWVGSAPLFTTKPQGQTINDGDPLTISSAVSGTDLITYQWYYGKQAITDSIASGISGSTTDTINFQRFQYGQKGSYTLKATNRLGTASASTSISVRIAPIYDRNVSPYYAVILGKTVSLSAVVRSPSKLDLQWYDWKTNQPLVDGPTIKGAKTSKLTISKTTYADAKKYFLRATNEVDSIPSTIANLRVQSVPKILSITPDASPLYLPVNSNTTLSVDATGDDLVFQWYKNGAGIPAIGSARYDQSNYKGGNSSLDVNASGTYYVRVSNQVGGILSKKIKVNVVTPPSIIKNLPLKAAFATNSTLKLAFTVKSETMPVYEWHYGTTNTTLDTTIPGAIANTLKISKAQPSDSGYYDALATNIAGNTIIEPLYLIYDNSTKKSYKIPQKTEVWVGAPPKITLQPKSATIYAGDSVTFITNGTGDDLTYEWIYKKQTAINAATIQVTEVSLNPTNQTLTNFVGFNTSNLTITEAFPEHAGTYTLLLENPFKGVKSSAAKLTVKLAPPALLTNSTLILTTPAPIVPNPDSDDPTPPPPPLWTLTINLDAGNSTWSAPISNSTISGTYTYKNTGSTTGTINLIHNDAEGPDNIKSPIKLAFKTYATGKNYGGNFTTPDHNGTFSLSLAPAPAPLESQGDLVETSSLSLDSDPLFLGNSSLFTILKSLATASKQTNNNMHPDFGNATLADISSITITPASPEHSPQTYPLDDNSSIAQNDDGTFTLAIDGNTTAILSADGTCQFYLDNENTASATYRLN